MTFPVPDLDDRTFVELVAEARARARQACPEWTDLSVHDPGTALIEVFAHLTEVMLYRLNRLPEKAHLTFLNLIGLTRRPPSAAWVELELRRAPDHTGPVTVPAGTAVSTRQGTATEATFVTTQPALLAEAQDTVTVIAHHCELVEGELLGTGTGRPGQRFTVARPPVVVTRDPIDVLVGVQVANTEGMARTAARDHAGKTFEIWQQVASFADAAEGDRSYLLDRATGEVTFGDGTPGRGIPPAGAEVRAWYRVGGGRAGNVGAGMLTQLDTPVAGVAEVTNHHPAREGADLEDLDDAFARGPQELFSLYRAVTARDYEALASGTPGVARARAFTRVDVRPFAEPGEVEVVLVPQVPEEARPDDRLTVGTLLAHQVETARTRTNDYLQGRSALGTTCVTSWAKYKEVSVRGRVVVRPEEDPVEVAKRIEQRLYRAVSPLRPAQQAELNPRGWGFGEPLRASNVYRLLEQAEPGVRYVDEVTFVLGEAPDQGVRRVVADPHSPQTWYAAAGELLFRSANDGAGWEAVARFADEEIRAVEPCPRAVRPGMVTRQGTLALATQTASGARIHVSSDLGDTWRQVAELDHAVSDLAWIERETTGSLLVAGDKGLFEIPLVADGLPRQLVIDPADPQRSLYAVEACISPRGEWAVAAACQAQRGVFLSVQGGREGTFGNIASGLGEPVDSRCLAVHLDGAATDLWVGLGEVDPSQQYRGALRARLFESGAEWVSLHDGWTGGTCWQVAFEGRTAYAATQSAGVLTLATDAGSPEWVAPDVNCGLALRDKARFSPVQSVGALGGTVMAGGPEGVHRSGDGYRWAASANREGSDIVTVPGTWLLCSGQHQIEVVGGHAPDGD